MRRHRFEKEVWLPRARAEVFPFFADAGNLELLTPPWLHFRIVTPTPVDLRPGVEIAYRLRVHGVPLGWRSSIDVWEPPYRFVDRQLRGPYRLWIHRHEFVESDGGTLCRDAVEYAVWGGILVDRLLVRRDLEAIFRFRAAALRRLFGASPSRDATEDGAARP